MKKILLLLCPLAIFWGFNHHNMPLQFSMLLGGIVAPYVIQFEDKKGGIRFAIAAALVGLSLVFFRSNSLYYFFSVFLAFYILENYWGRINSLSILLGVVIAPVISTIVYIWSFPIRLQLSEWAGKVLRLLQMDIQVQGNIVYLDGHTFSVDPACIGLKMVITALILGIVILAYFEKKTKKHLSFSKASSLLMLILMGAIAANFIRLLTLILFHILPENPLHDAIGLWSIVLYTLLPFYLLVYYFYKKKWLVVSSSSSLLYAPSSKIVPVILLSLFILQIFVGRQFLSKPIENKASIQHIQLENFQRDITPNGVLKLQNKEALIYIKPPVRFFQGSHDPRFCWQGSGYVFSNIQIQTIGEKEIYTATLQKETDTMYTAWWYENQVKNTPHEWEWRWDSFKGDGGGFYMININCLEKADLGKWIQKELL